MADDESTAGEAGLEDARLLRRGAGGAGEPYGSPGGTSGGPSNGGFASSAAAAEPGEPPGLEGLARRPPARVVKGPSGWIYHDTSIFCMEPHHPLRRVFIHFVEASFFEPFIALTIGANVVTMAWQSPLDESGTEKALFIEVGDLAGSGTHPKPCPALPSTLQRADAGVPVARCTVVRASLPRHLHRGDAGEDRRVRLRNAQLFVPARHLVPARLRRRLARVVRAPTARALLPRARRALSPSAPHAHETPRVRTGCPT